MGVQGCVCPHPPLLVPEIGGINRSRVAATVEAMERLGGEVGEPETTIVISPHTPGESRRFLVRTPSILAGDFAAFGCPHVRQEYATDVELVDRLIHVAESEGVPLDPEDDDTLDHGIMVPLGFLKTKRLVSLSVVAQYEPHAALGRLVRRAVDELGLRALFVASGDMSHRLTIDGPYAYNPQGPVFDAQVAELLGRGDFAALQQLDQAMVRDAGECGLRSLIALGAFLGEDAAVDPRVLSYEGPFGVGYLVAAFGGRAA